MERDVLPQQGHEQPAGSPNSVSELASKVLKGSSHVSELASKFLKGCSHMAYGGTCVYCVPGPLFSPSTHAHRQTHTLGNFDLGKSRDPQKSQLFLVSQFIARQCWIWGKIRFQPFSD